MAKKKPHTKSSDQSYARTERLFCRVRRNNIGRDGKATWFAFVLPDMSVNREKLSTADEARKGHDKADWGVSAFVVGDIPPRSEWAHIAQVYRLAPRHVPMTGNHAHSEVRIWRKADGFFVLITDRTDGDFEDGDPDREVPRRPTSALLDRDFDLRWRKHIARAAKLILPCEGQSA